MVQLYLLQLNLDQKEFIAADKLILLISCLTLCTTNIMKKFNLQVHVASPVYFPLETCSELLRSTHLFLFSELPQLLSQRSSLIPLINVDTSTRSSRYLPMQYQITQHLYFYLVIV